MSESAEGESQKSEGKLKDLVFKLVPYFLVLILGAFIAIYIVQSRPARFGLAKGVAAEQAEVNALVAEVGKLINLPTDERPTVATVTDASKVKDQPFFKNAQNGDKVLIYQKAQKAILYRPSKNRIIEVGVVNINQQEVSPSPSPSSSPSPVPTKAPKG